MTTIPINIPKDAKFVHITTTTDKGEVNTPSPESKVIRQSYQRMDDGTFKKLR